jgi:hypothetical protein
VYQYLMSSSQLILMPTKAEVVLKMLKDVSRKEVNCGLVRKPLRPELLHL